MAVLEPAQFDDIVKLTGMLKVLFPGGRVDGESLKMLLVKYAQVLSEEGYSFYSINKGIDQCLLNNESNFMPTIQVLNSYIKPIDKELHMEMYSLKISLEHNIEYLIKNKQQKQVGGYIAED